MNQSPTIQTTKAGYPAFQKISLGPIIGKVTSTEARVLVEYTQDSLETLSLIAPDGQQIDSQKQVLANRPTVFQFTGLTPKTIYTVASSIPFPVENSSFRTLSSEPAPINFAFNSCNSRKTYNRYDDKNNLWGDIAGKALRKEIDYIIHLGDQIYVDYYNDVYDKCIALIKKTPRENWDEIAEQVRELIRIEYRLTFGGKLEALALANCPSIMQFDDHEARDDLGFRPEDTDPNTVDGFYLQQARFVYYEYQRQLREDVDFSNIDSVKYEFHSHILNNVGLFFLDYRGKNSWLKAPEKGHLGKAQWAALKKAFKPVGGDFENCQMTIVVSTIPLVMYSTGWTRLIKAFVDDAQEGWEFQSQQEHAEFLSLLDDWKIAKNGAREVFAVGGDVHHAGHTDILRDNRKSFSQLITSGICQEMVTEWELLLSKLAMGTDHRIYEDWKFQHYGWTKRNNYGLVSVANSATPSFTVQLITSTPNSEIQQEELVTYTAKKVQETASNCCCNIF